MRLLFRAVTVGAVGAAGLAPAIATAHDAPTSWVDCEDSTFTYRSHGQVEEHTEDPSCPPWSWWDFSGTGDDDGYGSGSGTGDDGYGGGPAGSPGPTTTPTPTGTPTPTPPGGGGTAGSPVPTPVPTTPGGGATIVGTPGGSGSGSGSASGSGSLAATGVSGKLTALGVLFIAGGATVLLLNSAGTDRTRRDGGQRVPGQRRDRRPRPRPSKSEV